MAELTNCQICKERYNKTEKMPKILNCGHTFCKECLINKNTQYDKFECPICHENQTIDNPEQLITNRMIFDLLYKPKIEEENNILSDNISQRSNSINLDNISFKIIMIGPSGSGKTSLVKRYVHKEFTDCHKVTVGFDFMRKELIIDKKKIKMELWDTAGTEMFQSLSSSYIRNSYGALVVFDIVDRKSFESLKNWIKFYRDNKDENKEDLLYLVGNKIDLTKERAISKSEAENFMDENNLKKYFEASAKNGNNVDKIFNSIAIDLVDIYVKNKKIKFNSEKINLNKGIKGRKKESNCRC